MPMVKVGLMESCSENMLDMSVDAPEAVKLQWTMMRTAIGMKPPRLEACLINDRQRPLTTGNDHVMICYEV